MLRATILVAVLLAAAGVLGSASPAVGTADTHAPSRAVSETRWVWPVDSPHPILRPFIAPATPYSAGHRGIDVASSGSNVYTPASGVVTFSGVVVDRPVLSIRHPGGLVSSFEPVESTLVAGDEVATGQLVGTLIPGHCDSLCLHFGVRKNGEYVSPLNFLGGVPRSGLLPTRMP
jgi:murein DD-endopeptidase MepM/ murein hydrolase activator NlpD